MPVKHPHTHSQEGGGKTHTTNKQNREKVIGRETGREDPSLRKDKEQCIVLVSEWSPECLPFQ